MGSRPFTRVRLTTSTSDGEAGRIDRPPAPPSPGPAALWALVKRWESQAKILGSMPLDRAAHELAALLPPEAP